MVEKQEMVRFEAYSTSVCPECLNRIPMRIYEENGVIYLEKTCPEHGKFEDVYWGMLSFSNGFTENGTTRNTAEPDWRTLTQNLLKVAPTIVDYAPDINPTQF